MKLSGREKKLAQAVDMITGSFWNNDPYDLHDENSYLDMEVRLSNEYKIRNAEKFLYTTIGLFGDDADLDFDIEPWIKQWKKAGGTRKGAEQMVDDEFGGYFNIDAF